MIMVPTNGDLGLVQVNVSSLPCLEFILSIACVHIMALFFLQD